MKLADGFKFSKRRFRIELYVCGKLAAWLSLQESMNRLCREQWGYDLLTTLGKAIPPDIQNHYFKQLMNLKPKSW